MAPPSPTTSAPHAAPTSWRGQLREDAALARRIWWASAGALLRAPGVAWARFGLEALTWVLTLVVAIGVLQPSLVELWSNLEHLERAWEVLHDRWTSPAWLAAVSLAGAGAIALHVGLGAWADALVWSRALSTTPPPPEGILARALQWRALRALMRLGMGVLSAMVYVGLLRLSMMSQGVVAVIASGAIYALGLTALMWLSLSLEYAGAWHALTGESLGESLVEACGLCARRLYGAYKLVVMSATLSAPALLLSVALNAWAPSSALGGAAVALGQVLAMVSLSLSVTVFRAASVRWVVAQRGGETAQASGPSQGSTFESLADLLPTSYEHVMRLSQALEPAQDASQEE